ncbi:MAG TPA: hypothetical protein VEB21_16985 [Terriglobales bacterium]|nr:hypothetical protein [Terriglobales bacterium]
MSERRASHRIGAALLFLAAALLAMAASQRSASEAIRGEAWRAHADRFGRFGAPAPAAEDSARSGSPDPFAGARISPGTTAAGGIKVELGARALHQLHVAAPLSEPASAACQPVR